MAIHPYPDPARGIPVPLPSEIAGKVCRQCEKAGIQICTGSIHNSIVLAAVGVYSYNMGDSEAVRSRFTIEDSYEGSLVPGEAISLLIEAAEGQRYLIYLRSKTDPETGVSSGMETVPGTPFEVIDGMVVFDGGSCPLKTVADDIARQRSILTVPSAVYYYTDPASLIEACDEIVIARVLSVSDPTPTVCRSSQRGESTLNTLDQVFLSLSVEAVLMGEGSEGETLDVVLEPSNVRPVINAVDLTPKRVSDPPETAPRAGSAYVFFLLKSEDPKSSRFFTVNPYEGYVLLVGETLLHPYYNEAMGQVNDIARLEEMLGSIG